MIGIRTIMLSVNLLLNKHYNYIYDIMSLSGMFQLFGVNEANLLLLGHTNGHYFNELPNERGITAGLIKHYKKGKED